MVHALPLATRGPHRAAFVSAFLFALVASAGLLGERLAQGRSDLGWILSAAVTLGAVLLVVSARVFAPRTARHHVVGALCAIAAVHVVISVFEPFGPALVEGPAQVVNDAVLIFVILGLVWSFVAPRGWARAALPVLSFACLAAYGLTPTLWHLDPFPGFAVQSYVVGQTLATAGALLIGYLVADWTRR